MCMPPMATPENGHTRDQSHLYPCPSISQGSLNSVLLGSLICPLLSTSRNLALFGVLSLSPGWLHHSRCSQVSTSSLLVRWTCWNNSSPQRCHLWLTVLAPGTLRNTQMGMPHPFKLSRGLQDRFSSSSHGAQSTSHPSLASPLPAASWDDSQSRWPLRTFPSSFCQGTHGIL